jgi:hypothetical protein
MPRPKSAKKAMGPPPRPKKRKIYLTLSDECRSQLDAIRADRPELQSVSVAVEWAVRVAASKKIRSAP